MDTIPYIAPVTDLAFVLHDLLEVSHSLPRRDSAANPTRADIDQLMNQLAEFAETEVAPLNAIGHEVGCQWADGEVTTPPGFREAYLDYCRRGWTALAATREHGGRELPEVVANLVTEILGSANHSWLMYSSMSRGAYECIRANGSARQKAEFLARLASGRWTGSMCITEAGAGTDVGLISTLAEPMPDGSYRLTGIKRMATNAEHDLSENILHLVLARIEGSPAGSKGLSLFVVPKFLPARDGPSRRNGVRCEGLEDKMGIRGTPTCWMRFDGAEGELLGKPNQGLAAMFVMMNVARLGTGMQGVNQAERAFQLARTYARSRRQGRASSSPAGMHDTPDALIAHADVRRMLMTQKAWIEAGRAFAYWTALQVDIAEAAADEGERRRAANLVALLTPVLKAFSTDNGLACATLGQQVLGGVGYLDESSAAQFVADVRVAQIYEGANGIQAMDLLGRKVLADRGERLEQLLGLVEQTCEAAGTSAVLSPMAAATLGLVGSLRSVTGSLLERSAREPDVIGASAANYLRLVGHVVYAWLWLRMARIAETKASGNSFYKAKVATARFYFDHLFPEVHHALAAVQAPAADVMELAAEEF